MNTAKKTTPTTRVGEARGGRPELLTPELEKQIIALVRMGATPAAAAMSLGVARPTIYLWLKKGRHKVGAQYVAFLRQVEKAKSLSMRECNVIVVCGSPEERQALVKELGAFKNETMVDGRLLMKKLNIRGPQPKGRELSPPSSQTRFTCN